MEGVETGKHVRNFGDKELSNMTTRREPERDGGSRREGNVSETSGEEISEVDCMLILAG